MHEPIEVQLNLYSDTTVGTLRRFLTLVEDAPNDAPVNLVYDDDTHQLCGISTAIQ